MMFTAAAFLLNLVWCIPVAGIVQQVGEWTIHKYILHPWGMKKGSFFHYHWEHHNRCRKNNNIDHEYVDMFNWKFSPMVKKEIFLMFGLNLVTALPMWFLFPPMAVAIAGWQWLYFFYHAFMHTEPSASVPERWHVEHHMGKDQNLNWCVTAGWPDVAMKTSTVAKKYTDL